MGLEGLRAPKRTGGCERGQRPRQRTRSSTYADMQQQSNEAGLLPSGRRLWHLERLRRPACSCHDSRPPARRGSPLSIQVPAGTGASSSEQFYATRSIAGPVAGLVLDGPQPSQASPAPS